MADFYPDGRVRLIEGVPWSSDYRDTRYFSSPEEQTEYFLNKSSLYDAAQCSYTHIGRVACGVNIESLWNCNYIMYQNQNMGNKWFYAFVDRLEMKAAATTWVYFHIDEVQTWMFDAEPVQAFIERRHFDKSARIYSAEENIGTGWGYDTVKEELVDYSSYESMQTLLISSVSLTHDPGNYDDPAIVGAGGSVVHGLPSGCDYYILGGGFATVSECMDYIKDYPWVSRGIISATIIPSEIVNNLQVHSVSLLANGPTIGKVGVNYGKVSPSVIFSKNILDGFPAVSEPKLLMYPFSYVELSCFTGQTIIIKPQLTSDGLLNIARVSALQPQPQLKYFPTNYSGIGDYYDNAITVADFPICPVQDVSYLTTLNKNTELAQIAAAQLQFNTQNSLFSTGVSGVAGVLDNAIRGNVAGGIQSAFGAGMSAWSAYGGQEFSKQKIELELNYADTQVPGVIGNVGGTGFNYVTAQTGLHVRWKMIGREHREIIQDYFRLRGYSCKRIETVNPNRMTRFDYIKTQDCHVTGSIPNESCKVLEAIYDSGITFWHDDAIGNYDGNEPR